MSHANGPPPCDLLVIPADRSGKVRLDLAESPSPNTGTRSIYQHQRDPDGELCQRPLKKVWEKDPPFALLFGHRDLVSQCSRSGFD